jgi:type IV pilus assembly protein PilA
MSEAMTLASGLKVPVSEVYSQNGTCPANGTSGVAAAADIKGKYVATVTTGGTGSATGGCTIQAAMNAAGVATGIQSATLTLTMATSDDAGSYVWACTSSAKQKYLPTGCTGV